jgi:hypothetical protein
LKFFYCNNCQSEKPIEKRLLKGRKLTCTDCEASAAEYKRTGVWKPCGPYARAVGHKQDAWTAEDHVPQHIIESYAESLAD